MSYNRVKTCHIYKSILQTINTVVQTLSRVPELIFTKYIIIKVDVGLLLFGGPKPV
jgi:hypothetical protein